MCTYGLYAWSVLVAFANHVRNLCIWKLCLCCGVCCSSFCAGGTSPRFVEHAQPRKERNPLTVQTTRNSQPPSVSDNDNCLVRTMTPWRSYWRVQGTTTTETNLPIYWHDVIADWVLAWAQPRFKARVPESSMLAAVSVLISTRISATIGLVSTLLARIRALTSSLMIARSAPIRK